MIKDEIEEVREKAERLKQESSLAMILLHELKVSSKRWFISFIVTLIALIGTNIGWLIYNSKFETIESSTMELFQEDVNSSNQSGVIN